MFSFGKASLDRRATIWPDGRRILDRAMSWQIMDFSITQARRSLAEQTALYAQGRQPLAVVNDLRHKAGMPPITAAENQSPVTWTMQSSHLPNADGWAEAFDVAPSPYDPKDTARAWMLQGILLAAAAVEGVAVRSGADFNQNKNYRDDKTQDVPHIERAGQ